MGFIVSPNRLIRKAGVKTKVLMPRLLSSRQKKLMNHNHGCLMILSRLKHEKSVKWCGEFDSCLVWVGNEIVFSEKSTESRSDECNCSFFTFWNAKK